MFVKSFNGIEFDKGTEQPDLRPVSDPKIKVLYRLNEKTVIGFSGSHGDGLINHFILDLKANLYVDGQSVPQPFWSLGYRPDGCARLAALVHDSLYRSKGATIIPLPSGRNKGYIVKLTSNGQPVTLSRKAVDQLYKATYLYASEHEIKKAKSGYFIVRTFGWLFWGKDNLK